MLVSENKKEYKCEKCGISEWMGDKITLQLHHANGVHADNRLENLMILCPNCHSQTDSYCGKSSGRKRNKKKLMKNMSEIKKTVRELKQPPISRETLKSKIRNIPFVSIAKQCGVTDNTVRKWCKKYNLPYRTKDIKKYTDEEWEMV